MDEDTPSRKTEHITIVTNGQTPVHENWPVSRTDYASMLASSTLLPVRATIQLERLLTHDEILMTSNDFYWNWLDEPEDGLVFTAFHQRGQLPQVVIRYFDKTNTFLIAGADDAKVNMIKEQAQKL